MADNVDDFIRNLGDPDELPTDPAGVARVLRERADQIERGERTPNFILLGLETGGPKYTFNFMSNMRCTQCLIALSQGTYLANKWIYEARDPESNTEQKEDDHE